MNVTAPHYFWEPLRQRVVRNTIGHLPLSGGGGGQVSRRPQVLYISRQRQENGRRLAHTAHADLVRALRELEKDGICDVIVAAMETLSFQEQVRLSASAVVSCSLYYILRTSLDIRLKDYGWRAWEWAHGKFQESDEPRVTE